MYQVPDFHDRNRSSFAEAAGRAEGVGQFEKLVLDHAHFLSHADLSLFPSMLTASCSHFVTFQWLRVAQVCISNVFTVSVYLCVHALQNALTFPDNLSKQEVCMHCKTW